MTKHEYDTEIWKLNSGNFTGDRNLLLHVGNGVYEMKQTIDALWECCKKQRDEISREKGAAAAWKRSLEVSQRWNKDLQAKLTDAQDEADSLRAQLVQTKTQLNYLIQQHGDCFPLKACVVVKDQTSGEADA